AVLDEMNGPVGKGNLYASGVFAAESEVIGPPRRARREGCSVGLCGVRRNSTRRKGAVPMRPGMVFRVPHERLPNHERMAGAVGEVPDAISLAFVELAAPPTIVPLEIENAITPKGAVTAGAVAGRRYRCAIKVPDESRVPAPVAAGRASPVLSR